MNFALRRANYQAQRSECVTLHANRCSLRTLLTQHLYVDDTGGQTMWLTHFTQSTSSRMKHSYLSVPLAKYLTHAWMLKTTYGQRQWKIRCFQRQQFVFFISPLWCLGGGTMLKGTFHNEKQVHTVPLSKAHHPSIMIQTPTVWSWEAQCAKYRGLLTVAIELATPT